MLKTDLINAAGIETLEELDIFVTWLEDNHTQTRPGAYWEPWYADADAILEGWQAVKAVR